MTSRSSLSASEFVLLLDGSRAASYGRQNSSLQKEIDVARAFKKAASLPTTVCLWGWHSVARTIDVDDPQCLKNWIPSPLPSLSGAVDILDDSMKDKKNKRFVILSDGDIADDADVLLDKMGDFFSENPHAVIDLVFMPQSLSPETAQLAGRLYQAFPGQINLHETDTASGLEKTMDLIAASTPAHRPPLKRYKL